MKANQKTIITLVLFIAAVLLFAGGVVYPIFRGVVKDHAKMLEQKKELLQVNENRERLKDFEAVSVQYETEFAATEDLFVDQETPVSFFRFLNETAKTFGLQTEKIPDDPKQLQGDAWPSAEVRLAGTGTYEEVMKFVETIEKAPYLLEVKGLSLAQEGSTFSFSMAIKFFVR